MGPYRDSARNGCIRQFIDCLHNTLDEAGTLHSETFNVLKCTKHSVVFSFYHRLVRLHLRFHFDEERRVVVSSLFEFLHVGFVLQ